VPTYKDLPGAREQVKMHFHLTSNNDTRFTSQKKIKFYLL